MWFPAGSTKASRETFEGEQTLADLTAYVKQRSGAHACRSQAPCSRPLLTNCSELEPTKQLQEAWEAANPQKEKGPGAKRVLSSWLRPSRPPPPPPPPSASLLWALTRDGGPLQRMSSMSSRAMTRSWTSWTLRIWKAVSAPRITRRRRAAHVVTVW
jgi:hypothetical protein